jgi:hypothetical protein
VQGCARSVGRGSSSSSSGRSRPGCAGCTRAAGGSLCGWPRQTENHAITRHETTTREVIRAAQDQRTRSNGSRDALSTLAATARGARVTGVGDKHGIKMRRQHALRSWVGGDRGRRLWTRGQLQSFLFHVSVC